MTDRRHGERGATLGAAPQRLAARAARGASVRRHTIIHMSSLYRVGRARRVQHTPVRREHRILHRQYPTCIVLRMQLAPARRGPRAGRRGEALGRAQRPRVPGGRHQRAAARRALLPARRRVSGPRASQHHLGFASPRAITNKVNCVQVAAARHVPAAPGVRRRHAAAGAARARLAARVSDCHHPSRCVTC